jgi:hypothetical protein
LGGEGREGILEKNIMKENKEEKCEFGEGGDKIK